VYWRATRLGCRRLLAASENPAFGQELSSSRCRRFRVLSPYIFRPVHETSGSVHETSENDKWRCRFSRFRRLATRVLFRRFKQL
jgi:hypothetical protein